eukprot:3872720-Prymnesium_polylepis.1
MTCWCSGCIGQIRGPNQNETYPQGAALQDWYPIFQAAGIPVVTVFDTEPWDERTGDGIPGEAFGQATDWQRKTISGISVGKTPADVGKCRNFELHGGGMLSPASWSIPSSGITANDYLNAEQIYIGIQSTYVEGINQLQGQLPTEVDGAVGHAMDAVHGRQHKDKGCLSRYVHGGGFGL